MSNEEDREALARLVDPKAWKEPILPETYRAVSRDESLMKADAILAAGFRRCGDAEASDHSCRICRRAKQMAYYQAKKGTK